MSNRSYYIIVLSLFILLFATIGIYLIWSLGLRVIAGIFFLIWANNISMSLHKE